MNTEEARVKTSGRHGRDHGDDDREVKPACDRDLPRRSVETLRDLGLSKEKIVAYWSGPLGADGWASRN